MTATVNSVVALTVAIVLASGLDAISLLAQGSALRLRATAVATPTESPLTIDLYRWSTDAERAPLLAALVPPAAAPAAAPAREGAPAAGRAGRAGGRGGRGGRGAAPNQSPRARLSVAVKAAPTLGFVWGSGVTGYSIKYAWRASAPADGSDRIVLVTDRRLGAHWPAWSQVAAASTDEDFTVIEMRLDPRGSGEAKTSLTTSVIVDAAAPSLALEGYGAARAMLTVTR
jgi:hypothetical protein